MSSALAITSRMTVHRSVLAGLAAALSGSTRCRSDSCSSGEPFRQISVSPATLNTCGHTHVMNQPSLSAPAASSTRISSEARPMARRMPAESVRAWLAMLVSWPGPG